MQTPLRLMRSRDDKMIAGVAGGIGRYLNVDPVIVRLTFVLLAFSGASMLIYPLLWMIMPEEPAGAPPDGQVFVAEGTPTQRIRIDLSTGAPQLPEQEIPIQNLGGGASPAAADAANRQRMLGLVLLGIGAFVAVKLLFPGVGPLLVPIILVVGGVLLLRRGVDPK